MFRGIEGFIRQTYLCDETSVYWKVANFWHCPYDLMATLILQANPSLAKRLIRSQLFWTYFQAQKLTLTDFRDPLSPESLAAYLRQPVGEYLSLV